MTDQRSKGSKGGKDEPGLDRVLRELGRDVLDEPIPERLLRVLRQRKKDGPARCGPEPSSRDGDESGAGAGPCPDDHKET